MLVVVQLNPYLSTFAGHPHPQELVFAKVFSTRIAPADPGDLQGFPFSIAVTSIVPITIAGSQHTSFFLFTLAFSPSRRQCRIPWLLLQYLPS
jgi:hypothetical protein